MTWIKTIPNGAEHDRAKDRLRILVVSTERSADIGDIDWLTGLVGNISDGLFSETKSSSKKKEIYCTALKFI